MIQFGDLLFEVISMDPRVKKFFKCKTDLSMTLNLNFIKYNYDLTTIKTAD